MLAYLSCTSVAEETTATSPNEESLGPEFADVATDTGNKLCGGIAKILELQKEDANLLKKICVFLARTIAFDIGAAAVGQSHVPFNKNGSQAEKNSQVGKAVGTNLVKGADGLPVVSKTPPEVKETAEKLNGRIASLIAATFGGAADTASAASANE